MIYFGELNGYKKLVDRILSKEHKLTPILTKKMFKPFYKVIFYISTDYAKLFIQPIKDILLKFTELSFEELRKFPKDELKKTLSKFKTLLRRIDYDSYLEFSQIFDLKFAYKELTSQFLELRVSGLEKICELSKRVLSSQKMAERYGTRYSNPNRFNAQ